MPPANPKALTLQSVASFPGLGCWVRLRMLSGAVSRPETTIATTRSWAQASRMRYIFLHTVQGSGFTIVCKLEAILRSAGTVFSSSTTSMQALVTDCFLGSCLLSKTTQARRWIAGTKLAAKDQHKGIGIALAFFVLTRVQQVQQLWSPRNLFSDALQAQHAINLGLCRPQTEMFLYRGCFHTRPSQQLRHRL